MKKYMLLVYVIMLGSMVPTLGLAQGLDKVETPFDGSKLFIVIIVLLTIFVGIFIFLLILNKKIDNLINQLKK